MVTACEWGGARVFRNEKGRLTPWEITLAEPGNVAAAVLPPGCNKLSGLSGLWTCVASGDFDADGRPDLVLGNWGLNSAYQQVAPGPYFLYYGDFSEDGRVHLIEAYRDPGLNQIVPWRDLGFMERDLPWLRARFPTHKAYAEASLSGILGERKAQARELKSELLASVLLLNRGEKLEIRLLPAEAQWSPVMGAAVGDLDGDGKEDLLLSQNCFAVRSEDARLDAGRGLVLRGDGGGGFTPLSGQASGIKVYGEQRGCALADYDADGRVDVVITQNNEQTRLFHNITAQPGLRVRLAGPAANPDGVGSVIRLDYGGHWGPAREVQAGNGCCSQNSPVQVLGRQAAAAAVQVRWPGGKTTTSSLTAAAQEVQVSPDGSLKVIR